MKNLNRKLKEKLGNFFDWVKGAELVELKTCNVTFCTCLPIYYI